MIAFIVIVIFNWGVVYLMGFVLMFAMPVLITVFGIIGLVKDRVIVMAIIGLNLGLGYSLLLLMRYITYFL